MGVLLFFVGLLPAQKKELRERLSPDVTVAVAPEWPRLSKADMVKPQTNTVLVRVTVDGFGNVVAQKLLTARSAYSDAALKASLLWKFQPPCTDLSENINGMSLTLKFEFRVLRIDASIGEFGTAFIRPDEVQLSRRAMEQ